MGICMHKDHIHTLKITQSMSEFNGLRKQQNNPMCTKSVRVFIMLMFDTIWKKKKTHMYTHCTIL